MQSQTESKQIFVKQMQTTTNQTHQRNGHLKQWKQTSEQNYGKNAQKTHTNDPIRFRNNLDKQKLRQHIT